MPRAPQKRMSSLTGSEEKHTGAYASRVRSRSIRPRAMDAPRRVPFFPSFHHSEKRSCGVPHADEISFDEFAQLLVGDGRGDAKGALVSRADAGGTIRKEFQRIARSTIVSQRSLEPGEPTEVTAEVGGGADGSLCRASVAVGVGAGRSIDDGLGSVSSSRGRGASPGEGDEQFANARDEQFATAPLTPRRPSHSRPFSPDHSPPPRRASPRS